MQLIDFIKEHKDWEALLSSAPYSLKISRLTMDGKRFILFKYNQISSDFSLPIVQEARGVILDEDTLCVVCRGFDKFFNYGEPNCSEIDWTTASVQEKIDGSLIKVWYYNGTWHVSTNGGIDAFRVEYSDGLKTGSFGDLFIACDGVDQLWSVMSEAKTYMFELVSPQTRVVIPYAKTDLYFIGIRDNATGIEIDPMSSVVSKIIKTPKRYDMFSLEDVEYAANRLPWDREGYVVCDANFRRIKIKSPEYVKAHYARNNGSISRLRLLEIILTGEENEFLCYAADYKEKIDEVKSIMRSAEIDAMNFAYSARTEHSGISRKDYAAWVSTMPVAFKDFLFKNCTETCWWKNYIADWDKNDWDRFITSYLAYVKDKNENVNSDKM